MVMEEITRQFREVVCREISLVSEGLDRARVLTPFQFDDGDHLVIVVRRGSRGWELSDEGHTFMRLTYSLDEGDLRRGMRQTIIEDALSMFSVEDRDGSLVLPVSESNLGNGLYSFVQAVLKISDVTYLTRETIRTAFIEDFRQFFTTKLNVPVQFGWFDPVEDPDGRYPVDCRLDRTGKMPFFVFALNSDDKVRDATIIIQHLETTGVAGEAVGIFEDQEAISRKVLARFTDVCGKQFSSLRANEDRIKRFMQAS